jgi:hypothetical protein
MLGLLAGLLLVCVDDSSADAPMCQAYPGAYPEVCSTATPTPTATPTATFTVTPAVDETDYRVYPADWRRIVYFPIIGMAGEDGRSFDSTK